MKLPFRRGDTTERTRGQAMVEFALILPLLVLLLVLAIDFGRVFFGSVALNNAARIGANEAAWNPKAWQGSGDPTLKALFRQQVANDLNAVGCQPVGESIGTPWTPGDVPDPAFMDAVGTADPHEIGDFAVLHLDCEFSFVTPLVGLILPDPLPVGAESKFPIKGGSVAGIPVGNQPPGAGCPDSLVPDMVGMSVAGARTAWLNAGFAAIGFNPLTGFDTESVLTQTTSPPSVPGSCIVDTATVLVTSTVSTCTAPEIVVPNLVGLTVGQARSQWTAAGFDAGTFSPASGSDANFVSVQTTSPSSSPGNCRPPTTTVTVTHAPAVPTVCLMPQLIGQKVNTASNTFSTAGFTGAFTATAPPNGNYTVSSQTLVGGQPYPCQSPVTVGGN